MYVFIETYFVGHTIQFNDFSVIHLSHDKKNTPSVFHLNGLHLPLLEQTVPPLHRSDAVIDQKNLKRYEILRCGRSTFIFNKASDSTDSAAQLLQLRGGSWS